VQYVLDLAGVLPEPPVEPGAHVVAACDQPLDGVGDLEFAACAGLDGGDRFVDGGGEEVHADHGPVAARVARLLHQPQHPAGGVRLRHAEVPGVGHGVHDQLGGGAVGAELVGDVLDALGQHVVAEVHHEVVGTEEVPGDGDAVGEPAGHVLPDVGEAQAERGAVAEGGGDLASPVADHDSGLPHAEAPQILHDVDQHWLVGDRHELFGHGVAEGTQPAAGPSRQHECFHRRTSIVGLLRGRSASRGAR
jgi:hypothetical protein